MLEGVESKLMLYDISAILSLSPFPSEIMALT